MPCWFSDYAALTRRAKAQRERAERKRRESWERMRRAFAVARA